MKDAASSDVRFRDRSEILGFDPDTISSVQLCKLINSLPSKREIDLSEVSIEEFLGDSFVSPFVSNDNAETLAQLFNTRGSDKARHHDYYRVYQPILDSLISQQEHWNLAEIGIGTNNIDTLSNMGASGIPGASLRAFRDYNENIKVFGGDIDKRILFAEDRIATCWVNQLEPLSIREFLSVSQPSLLIDDGLHCLRPNINVLIEFLDMARHSTTFNHKWLVVEDLGKAEPLGLCWLEILRKLEGGFMGWLVRTNLCRIAVICHRP